jgi:hypothetical protein
LDGKNVNNRWQKRDKTAIVAEGAAPLTLKVLHPALKVLSGCAVEC